MLDRKLKSFVSSSVLDPRPEQDNLVQTRQKYDELNQFIANLNLKLNNLYNFNEKEFLGTYRVHTLDLQSEIKYLKDKVRVAEEILNDDNTVSTLEHEANWFCEEADRLRSQSETMTRDLKALMERVDVLREQRLCLTDELKDALRHIRVYESEFPMSKSSMFSDSQAEEVPDFDIIDTTLPADDVSSHSQHKSNAFPEANARLHTSYSRQETGRGGSLKYRKEQPSQRDNPHIAYDKFMASRTWVEEGLEVAIKHTLDEEILPRKLAHVASRPNTRNLSTRATTATKSQGLTGLGLETFTDTDKLSAMIRFLCKQDNFEQVVNRLKDRGYSNSYAIDSTSQISH